MVRLVGLTPLIALPKHDLEQWDASTPRYWQQVKEMYDISSVNADGHFGLEQEFVSYHQPSEKQWRRSLNGTMQELPEMSLPAPEWATRGRNQRAFNEPQFEK